jgi:hypothetical protein
MLRDSSTERPIPGAAAERLIDPADDRLFVTESLARGHLPEVPDGSNLGLP